jgi:DNA mismatch repair protein MSH4
MKDALDETLLLSDKSVAFYYGWLSYLCSCRIVQDLIATIVLDIGALYKASEAISLLDMLWSFSHVSISNVLHFLL